MDNYQYTPLPDRKNIRVLTIFPSVDKHARIDCTIETAPLDESTNYTALSYTWGMNEDGDASLCGTIYIAGRFLPITRNLYQGLLRIRSKDTALRYWIDAVCINQQDVQERSSQVALMASIFGSAAATTVWLGEGLSEQDDHDAAFLWNVMVGFQWPLEHWEGGSKSFYHTIKTPYLSDSVINDRVMLQINGSIEVAGALRALVDPSHWKVTTPRDQWQAKHLMPCSPKIWEYCMIVMERVTLLLCRRYFNRLWIVQELYHARQGTITVLWGPCMMDGARFLAEYRKWRHFTVFIDSRISKESRSDSARQSLLHKFRERTERSASFTFPTEIALPTKRNRRWYTSYSGIKPYAVWTIATNSSLY